MPQTDGERIARIEAQIQGMRDRLTERERAQDERSDRLRELEAAVKMLLEGVRQTRRSAEIRNRNVVVWLQVLSLVVAVGGTLISLAIAFAAYHYH